MAKGCCLLGIQHWRKLLSQSEVILRFTHSATPKTVNKSDPRHLSAWAVTA